MADAPLVSIVLPIYNIQADYLRHCLETVSAQTYGRIEVILVDDGSSNDVPEVCADYCSGEPRAVYVYQDNAGVSVARNNGLSHAHGEYVCFVDPDDWLEPTYVEVLLNGGLQTKADIVVCGCVYCVGERREPNAFLAGGNRVLSGDEKNDLLYQLVGRAICSYYPPHIAAGVPWSKMFRMDFLRKKSLRFIPGMIRMQDNVFCLYAIQEADSIAYLDENLYCYRKDQASASHKYNPRIMGYFEFYFDRTREFLDRYHREDALYRALDAKTLTSINSYLANYFFHKDNPDTKGEANRKLRELLEEPRYADALSKVDNEMLTSQERIFVGALRKGNISALRLMVAAREALLNKG